MDDKLKKQLLAAEKLGQLVAAQSQKSYDLDLNSLLPSDRAQLEIAINKETVGTASTRAYKTAFQGSEIEKMLKMSTSALEKYDPISKEHISRLDTLQRHDYTSAMTGIAQYIQPRTSSRMIGSEISEAGRDPLIQSRARELIINGTPSTKLYRDLSAAKVEIAGYGTDIKDIAQNPMAKNAIENIAPLMQERGQAIQRAAIIQAALSGTAGPAQFLKNADRIELERQGIRRSSDIDDRIKTQLSAGIKPSDIQKEASREADKLASEIAELRKEWRALVTALEANKDSTDNLAEQEKKIEDLDKTETQIKEKTKQYDEAKIIEDKSNRIRDKFGDGQTRIGRAMPYLNLTADALKAGGALITGLGVDIPIAQANLGAGIGRRLNQTFDAYRKATGGDQFAVAEYQAMQEAIAESQGVRTAGSIGRVLEAGGNLIKGGVAAYGTYAAGAAGAATLAAAGIVSAPAVATGATLAAAGIGIYTGVNAILDTTKIIKGQPGAEAQLNDIDAVAASERERRYVSAVSAQTTVDYMKNAYTGLLGTGADLGRNINYTTDQGTLNKLGALRVSGTTFAGWWGQRAANQGGDVATSEAAMRQMEQAVKFERTGLMSKEKAGMYADVLSTRTNAVDPTSAMENIFTSGVTKGFKNYEKYFESIAKSTVKMAEDSGVGATGIDFSDVISRMAINAMGIRKEGMTIEGQAKAAQAGLSVVQGGAGYTGDFADIYTMAKLRSIAPEGRPIQRDFMTIMQMGKEKQLAIASGMNAAPNSKEYRNMAGIVENWGLDPQKDKNYVNTMVELSRAKEMWAGGYGAMSSKEARAGMEIYRKTGKWEGVSKSVQDEIATNSIIAGFERGQDTRNTQLDPVIGALGGRSNADKAKEEEDIRTGKIPKAGTIDKRVDSAREFSTMTDAMQLAGEKFADIAKNAQSVLDDNRKFLENYAEQVKAIAVSVPEAIKNINIDSKISDNINKMGGAADKAATQLDGLKSILAGINKLSKVK